MTTSLDFNDKAWPSLDVRIKDLRARYDDLDGAALIHAIHREFEDNLAVVTSFGTESAVLLALVAEVNPDLPVFFVNTTMLFPETLQYKDALTAKLGLTNVQALHVDAADMAGLPKDECCGFLKGDVLDRKMDELGIKAWISGLKNFQGGNRENARQIQESRGRVNINPLARWEKEAFEQIFIAHALPRHPLSLTFASVGCTRCTKPSGGTRAEARNFCGLHPGDRRAAANNP